MRRRLLAALGCVALLWACGTRTIATLPADASTDAADAGDFARCDGPGSCLLVPRSCCGTCGAATPADMIGVASSRSSAYRLDTCHDSACPACYREQDPFLQSFCEGGACRAVDLHGDALTACSVDADCRLRYAACCEPCATPTTGLLALRVDAMSAYREKVCAADAACPKCAVGYPPGFIAACDATGHCAVVPPTR